MKLSQDKVQYQFLHVPRSKVSESHAPLKKECSPFTVLLKASKNTIRKILHFYSTLLADLSSLCKSCHMVSDGFGLTTNQVLWGAASSDHFSVRAPVLRESKDAATKAFSRRILRMVKTITEVVYSLDIRIALLCPVGGLQEQPGTKSWKVQERRLCPGNP